MRREIDAQVRRIDSRNDDIYILNFGVGGAALDRQGDDLVMRMPDGRELVFGNFYRNGRASFIIEDQEFSAKEFFAALDAEKLAPAMGPASGTQAATSAQNGQSAHHSWESMSSLEGTWHLDGLDLGNSPERESFAALSPNIGEAPSDPPAAPTYAPEFPKSLFADEDALDKPAIIEIPAGFTVVSITAAGAGHVEQLPDGTWAYYPEPINSGRTPGRNDVENADRVVIVARDPSGVIHEVEIPVTMRDDVPEAVFDGAAVIEDASPSVSGNVLDNDDPGADGLGSLVWLDTAAKYGRITLNPDGTYEYRLDSAKVQHLSEGETLTETFRYRITDTDGDESEAYLTITIRGSDDGVTITPENPADPDPDIPVIPTPFGDGEIPEGILPSTLTVNEAELGKGSVRAEDSMLIEAPDGLSEISAGSLVIWKDGKFIGGELATDEGRLVFEGFDQEAGRLSYSFILENASSEHGRPGTDAIAHNFRVDAKDKDGSSASSWISLRVIDDIPEARDDSARASESEPAVSGNVLSNDHAGADGFAGQVSWDGQAKYGELVLNPDGSWEYRLNADDPDVKKLSGGQTLEETVNYTVRDADGDETSASLTITISGRDDGVSIDAGSGAKVFEAELPGAKAAGHIDINAPDGVSRIGIAGQVIWENGALSKNPVIATDDGELRVLGFDPETGRLDYEYVLNKATQDHGGTGSDSVFRGILLLVEDADGTKAESRISIEIVDDVPAGVDDGNEIGEDSVSVTGFVLSNDLPGKDGFAENSVTLPEGTERDGAWVLKGRYGELVMRKDGSYEYLLDNANADVRHLAENAELLDSFAYSYRDGDGDEARATLEIAVKGRDNGVSFDADVSRASVSEADLGAGPVSSASREIRIDAPDGLKDVSIEGIDVYKDGIFIGGEIPSDEGRLVVDSLVPDPANPDGYILTWHFELDRSTQEHVEEGFNEKIAHDFALAVSDWDGTPTQAVIRVEIVDDVPMAGDVREIALTGATVKPGATLSGIFMLDAGADDLAGFEVNGAQAEKWGGDWVIDGEAAGLSAGSLILNHGENGWTYEFRPSAGGSIDLSFTLSAIDGDGDRADIDIHLVRDTVPVINSSLDADVSVGEYAANEGSNPHDGKNRPQSGEFSFMADLGGGDGVIGIGNMSIVIEGGEAKLPVDQAFGSGVSLSVKSADFIDGQWKITCEWNYDQAQDGQAHVNEDGDFIREIFNITVRDDNGDEARGHVSIDVHDDVPTAVSDIAAVSENMTKKGNVTLNDDWHADGRGTFEDGSLVRWDAEGERKTDTDGRGYIEVDSAEGVAKLYDDGYWEYFAKDREDFSGEDSFHASFGYSIIDKDGDEAKSSLEIDVRADGRAPILADDGSKAIDEALLSENGAGDRDHPLEGKGELKADFNGEAGRLLLSENGVQFAEIALPDEGDEIALDQSHMLANGVLITLEKAVFEDGQWKVIYGYKLSEAQTHEGKGAVGSADSLGAEISILAIDATGDRAESKILIGVHDDGPEFGKDGALSFGADGMGTKPFIVNGDIEPVLEGGRYVFDLPAADGHPEGTLSVSYADGKFAYEFAPADPNLNYDGSFTLTATDRDGDTAEITLNVSSRLPAEIDAGEGEIALDEGMRPYHGEEFHGPASRTVLVNMHGQDGEITVAGIRIAVKDGKAVFDKEKTARVNGADISMESAELNAGGVWEVRLSCRYAEKHGQEHGGDGNSLPGEIAISVSTADNQEAAASVKLVIHDDVPEAKNDDDHEISEGMAAISGDALKNDDFGADGKAEDPIRWNGLLGEDGSVSIPASGTVLQGLYGTFTLNPDGTWEYALDNTNRDVMSLKDNENLYEKISYTIKDSDGDESDAVLTVTISGKSHDITITENNPDSLGNEHQDVDEARLPDGTSPAEGIEIFRGSIDVESADGIAAIMAQFGESGPIPVYLSNGFSLLESEKDGAWAGWKEMELSSGILHLRYAGTETTGRIEYAFEFDRSIGHPEGEGRNFEAESVIFTVLNSEGEEKTAKLDINIKDDMPVLTEIVESDGLSGQILINFGADHAHPEKAFAIAETDAEGNPIEILPELTDGGWKFTLAASADHPAGTLVIAEKDGNHSWTFTPDDPNLDFSGILHLAATDSDGDGVPFDLAISQDFEPEIIGAKEGGALDSQVIDEGAQPEMEGDHEGHDPEGSFVFQVNMHGKDGVIRIGETLQVAIEDGTATPSGEFSVNGIKVAIDSVELVGNNWEITLSYAYDQSAQGQDHSENDLSLPSDIAISVLDSDGYSAGSFIHIDLHDDAPVFGDGYSVDNNVSEEEGGVLIDDHDPVISGKIDFSMGADREGAQIIVTVAGQTYTGTLSEGAITFDSEDFSLDPDGNFSWKRPAEDLIATGDTYDFNVKLVDSDGDEIERTYSVTTYAGPSFGDGEEEIVNGVPVFRVPGAAIIEQNLGRVDAEGNPLATQTKTFLVSTHTEGGKLEITCGDQVVWAELDGKDNMMAMSENASITTGYGVFTLVGVKNGQATWNYELTKAHSVDDTDDGPDIDLIESLDLKITDNRNNDVTLGRIDINLTDDTPAKPQIGDVISGKIYSNTLDAVFCDPDGFSKEIADGATINPMNFFNANPGFDQEWAGVSRWPTSTQGTNKYVSASKAGTYAADVNGGLRLIATSAFLQYEKNGSDYELLTLKNVNTSDYASKIIGSSTIDYNIFDKNLYLTKDGLVVGGTKDVWNGGNSPYHNYLWNETETGLRPRTGYVGHVLSEAIVVENTTNTVAYNFNAQFGSIQSYDRIVISFLMTPKNSVDDVIIKIVEINPADYEVVDGVMKVDIAVPQGFTKTILAAGISNEDLKAGSGKVEYSNGIGNDRSGFTLQSIAFGKETWHTEGSFVDIDFGADGPADAHAFDWNFDNNDWQNVIVETESVPYSYKVVITEDGNGGYVGTFSGEKNPLDGKIAFKASLSENGDWDVVQYYNMIFGDGQPAINIEFSVKDADGDITSVIKQISLPETKLDRFDKVLSGYQDKTWFKPDASDDVAKDIIAGTNGNDLIYAKGDDDFVLGDGGADGMRALLKTLNFTDYTTNSVIMPNVDVDNSNVKNQTASGSTGTRVSAQGFLWSVFNKTGIAQNSNTSLNYAEMNKLLAQFEKDHPEYNGDDAIFGGKGNDILIGLGGDDFIDGGQGTDVIYAGSGNDIMIWDKDDIVVHGGAGIDILLSETAFTLADATNAKSVEVALSGKNITWLSNWDVLNQKGLSIQDGKFVIDGDQWTTDGSGQFVHITESYLLDISESIDYTLALKPLATTGSFTIRETDSLSGELAPEGYDIISVIAQGAMGKIEKIDGKWVYTLDEAYGHDPIQGANIAYGVDSVTLMLRDPKGHLYEGKFAINVVDDTPDVSVGADEIAVASGDVAEIPLALKYGADDGEGKSLWLTWINDDSEVEKIQITPGFEHETELGTLLIDPDTGEAMFDAKPNVSGTLHFGLEIRDADGDVKSLDGALNITVEKPAAPDFGTLEISERDGSGEIALPGCAITAITDAEGPVEFVKDESGNWICSVTDRSGITAAGSPAASAKAAVVDGLGNTYEIPLSISLIDAAPAISAENVPAEMSAGDSVSLQVAVDSLDGVKSMRIRVNDETSELEAGKWVKMDRAMFKLRANGNIDVKHDAFGIDEESEQLAFTLIVEDNDGSVSERDFAIDVVKPLPDVSGFELGEGGGSLPIELPGGWHIDSIISQGAHGALNGGVYALNGIVNHGGATQITDTLKVEARDDYGNKAVIDIPIRIIDSVPEASVSEALTEAILPGIETLVGKLSFDYKTDGPGRLEIIIDGERKPITIGEEIDTGKGALIISESGEIRFTPVSQNEPQTLSFQIAAIDSDGSETLANPVTVSIASAAFTWDTKGRNGAEGADTDDILFSDDSSVADIAAAIGMESYSSASEIAGRLRSDPEALAKAVEYVSGKAGTYGNVYGGAGDDIIIGQNGGEALFGDAFVKEDLNILLGGANDSIGTTLGKLQGKGEAELAKIASDMEDFERDHDQPTDGNDAIYGLGGVELVYGGGGNDLIDGGEDNNMLSGGSGDDTIVGGSDQDFIFGGSGNDVIDGRGAEDWIFAGSGNDIVTYGADAHLDGGAGIDILLAESGSLSDMANAKNFEILITGAGSAKPEDIGVSVSDASLSLDGSWTKTGEADGVKTFAREDGAKLETTLDEVGGGFLEEPEESLDDLIGAEGGSGAQAATLNSEPVNSDSGNMEIENAMRYVEDNQG